jgi:hypothetical protein
MLRRVAFVWTQVSEENRFLQEPQGVTLQQKTFFIVTAVKTSNSHNINLLDSVVEMYCDSCEVRTGFVYPRKRHSS